MTINNYKTNSWMVGKMDAKQLAKYHLIIKDIKEAVEVLEVKYKDLCELIKKDSNYYKNIEIEMLEEMQSLYITLKQFLIESTLMKLDEGNREERGATK